MSQDIQIIACKKIKSSKSGKKGLSNAVLELLHDSVSKEGLLNPISVRPDPESPGSYLIIAGEHRFHVVSRMMKEEAIECRVFADMSEEEAELAKFSENACRSHAKPADRLLALRKWQEVYTKHYPQLVGKRAAAAARWANSTKGEAKARAIEEEAAQDEAESKCNIHSGHCIDDTQAEGEAAVDPAGGDEKPQTFRERVAATTGAKKSSLTRDLKIINNLDEDQVHILDAVACTKMGMIKIVDATDDKPKRAEIVTLVASGMEVEQAIKEVVGVAVTKDAAGRIKDVGDVEPKPGPESDEEWFERHCSVVAPSIADPDQYKSDAILWRQIADARTEFRKKIKKTIAAYREDRKGRKVGWFFLQLNRVISVSHPNDWKICEKCGGSGSGASDGESCEKCHGAGYSVTTERYA